MAQNRGPWLSTATALFFSWALLSFCVRMWMNLGRHQQWRLAETTASAAFVVAVLHVATNFWAIQHGYGCPLLDLPETSLEVVEKALFASQISYILTVGLTRVSTAFFIKHLTRHARHTRIPDGFIAVSGLWMVTGTLLVALRGDLRRPWATLDGAESLFHRWMAVEATGLAIEIGLFALSIALVWGLQMKASKRILVLGIFGCRLLLIPIVAIRLYYLGPEENHNPTFTSIIPHVLTEGVLNGALMATSIPALKPFLQPLHTGASPAAAGAGGHYHSSGRRSQAAATYMLSSVAGKKELAQTTVSATPRTDLENIQHRPEVCFNDDERSSGNMSKNDGQQDDAESVESNSSRQMMIIRATKAWSVRYEDK